MLHALCLFVSQRTSCSPSSCFCSARLSQRATLRRILLWWRDAAAASACLGAKRCEAGALHRRTLLTAWLAKWQLATQRSQLLAEREAWRQAACLRTAWDAWRLGCHECVLRRGLDSAAEVHRQAALQRQVFGAWRERVAACAQVDLPEGHAALRAAATLQRRRRLRSYFTAWRQHITECVLPRQAAVQLRLLEQFMGSQRRALTAWQQYLQHRREVRMLKARASCGWAGAVLPHTFLPCFQLHASGSFLPACQNSLCSPPCG